MTRELTKKLFSEVTEGLRTQNFQLLELRDVYCIEHREAQIALNAARNKVSAALHDLRRAQTCLGEAWKSLDVTSGAGSQN